MNGNGNMKEWLGKWMGPLIALALAFVLGVLVSNAAEADESKQEKCESLAETAEMIMKMHHGGVPLATVLAIADNIEDPGLKKLARDITLDAYTTPRYSSVRVQLRAQGQFRDETLLACLRSELLR